MTSVNFDELENEALRLPVEKRARLADRLIRSLDDSSEEDVAQAWRDEALKRDRDLEVHPDQARPSDEVLRRLRKLVD